MDFRQTPVVELARQVRRKEVAARELTAHALDRIEALDGAVGAFVTVDGERALEQAAAVDQIVATGGDPGPLAGVPIGVKDLEDAAGYRTTYGSPLWADGPPAASDSALVARLRAAGCVVVGKTNTPEQGWSAVTDNALCGPTRNPWHLGHTAGGSSGGSAAAIAAGMVPLATGSDGGGSIRIPSSCCGLSGMKPSSGRVPSGGRDAPSWLDLSTKGPMARRMADVVWALDAVVGPEPTDLRSLPRPEASWPAGLDDPHLPVRVAWSPTLGYAPLDDEVRAICERAVGVLESLGSVVVEADPVFDEDPIATWSTIANACLGRTFEPRVLDPAYDRTPRLLQRMVGAGASLSAVDLVQALDECHRLNLVLVDLFHDVRLLVTPTLAAPPPSFDTAPAGRINGVVDPGWVRFTYPFNLTRSPAATVCAGLTADGLPVGLQLVGPQHADLVVLRAAAALETALGFDQWAPIDR
jgi:Asp-tRNA(Asn)/Glu-tRNA(Gln) amidotransferase A subunit family amidase